MNPLRQLISQTAIYGLSSIVGRFLNYLLVPLYTYTFSAGEYGVVTEFYAYAGFFAVLLVFGLETGYFRFRQKQAGSESIVYSNALGILLLINLSFYAALYYWQTPLAATLQYTDHPEYLLYFAGIMVLDAITAIPFAQLRSENRAWRFAGIKITEILLTIFLNLFFLLLCPKLLLIWPEAKILAWYQPQQGVGYIFLANLLASICKLLLLLPQFRGVRLHFQFSILFPMLRYSLPMVVIGFAGMINEMLDRAILKNLLPYDLPTNMKMLGIYGACYKLSILMSLFVQAFRYAGEPFFFSYADRSDAKHTYAMVMQYFVMCGVGIFLLVTLNIDFFQYFIGAEFRTGLGVVPILLLANLCFGVYVNLSIWYKLSDRTGLGAWVALAGAGVKIALNLLWIPDWGYVGAAWATLGCYGFMISLSWLLGRHYFPIPYPLAKIFLYVISGLCIYFSHGYLTTQLAWHNALTAALGILLFLMLVLLSDFKHLIKSD